MTRRRKNYFNYLLFSVVIFLLIKLFVFDIYIIKEDSMEPGLPSGSVVLLFRAAFGITMPFSKTSFISYSKPKRNDIIIFRQKNSKRLFIKRVIAIEGDVLEYKNNTLHINDNKEDTGNLKSKKSRFFFIGKIEVPFGSVFVMGDNREKSKDSRHYGTVLLKDIIGRVLFRIFPINNPRGVNNS